MKFWLSRFVLEIRKVDGEPYNPNTLYQICCGLLRHLRINCDRSDVNFLDDGEFQQFRSTLDAEMKRLNGTGKYIEKHQAQVITGADEDYLWRLRLLGEHSPQVLIDTIIYMTGLYFALRSGNEHRRQKTKVEEGKENLPQNRPTVDPVFQISGGSHITISIGCPQP